MRPGRPVESRVPAAKARRMAFVMGTSRRMARSGRAGAWAGRTPASVSSGRKRRKRGMRRSGRDGPA
ncbi:MAG: transposase [Gemmatimonadetes bacterium]|nr:transposase [Gemmatimonadota bacterium]